ncbi:hypothetical protein FA95DRAFT_1680251 [Auriscalpium vulgare]|uniref:Uncharacterized protein n=1 Tax=Auriscalpium vulgare TaxID=40419 RepID=A0ACB8RPB9_9AGAM|nr:hypothetical protein FA95DRAFT_1680251 [Auriscalpium vulgare]
MSRRDSRVSLNRQNDALLEFENFKKKFLLANKHITKLNSTLSVRIEELNAQISALYVENLRLRASEIALAAQLKKERDKSQRIMADAETAMHHFMKTFGLIRKSFNVPSGKPPSPPKHAPTATARRPALNPDASPHANRLARPPNFPEIFEEEEGPESDAQEDEERETSPSPVVRRKKPRASSSRLPVPASGRVISPPPPPLLAALHIQVDESLLKGRKRISRRTSGLLAPPDTTTRPVSPVPRPPSPAFGSPLRRDAGLAEEEEEYAVMHGGGLVVVPDDTEEEAERDRAARKERRKRAKARDAELAIARDRDRASQRAQEDDEPVAEGSKSRLKDVTNSPVGRSALPPLDTHISGACAVLSPANFADIPRTDSDRQRTPDSESDVPSSALTMASTSTRAVMSTPSTTPGPPSHLPTPRNSTSPPVPASDTDPGPAGGREKRVRKSVNYTEPKLNTKMRKPDPAPAPSTSTAKRLSTASQQPSPRTSLEDEHPTVTAVRRKKSRPRLPPEDDGDASDGAQADEEAVPRMNNNWVNVDGRRRSAHTTAMLASARRPLGDGDEARRHSMAV